MASCITPITSTTEKLRVLLLPFFATSHIQPFTELAITLSAANDAVEVTIAVTPANVSIVQSLLDRGQHNVKIATYPFPTVDGISKGVENLGKAATPEESLRIRVAAVSELVMRPAQEALIRAHSPDAIINDVLFFWNGRVADGMGVPCVVFSTTGAFPQLAMRHLKDVVSMDDNDDAVLQVPRFPAPSIRIPKRELPEFLRRHQLTDSDSFDKHQAECFGLVMNTSSVLEKEYCEMFTREGYVKRAYFVGPLALPPQAPATGECTIMDWLDSKPNRSVVYLSFGSMAQMKDAQLDELAMGLESSRESFMWVVRSEEWSPPKGWEERVQDRGLIVRAWAPQTAILGHPAVGAFVTHCGWNSVLETLAGGVPILTWPLVYEQFINERHVTDVLGIGERLWPDGAGLRSGRPDEHEVIPRQDVARALTTFMSPGGQGEQMRTRVMDLSAKVNASMAQGGSSHRDLHRLVDDLMAAAAAAAKKST